MMIAVVRLSLHISWVSESITTVKPVLSGPVLNGRPLLSGQLQKSRKFLLLTILNVTCIKQIQVCLVISNK